MQRAGPRVPVLGGLALLVVLVHALAFGGWRWTWPELPAPPAVAMAMAVRLVEGAKPAPVALMPERSSGAGVADAPPRPATAARVAASTPPPAPTRPRPRPFDPPAVGADSERAGSPPAMSEPGPEPPSATAATAAPRYPITLPPALRLQFDVRRDTQRGEATLEWHPQGASYEARLDARLDGVPLLQQHSQGRLSADGLAPERFTDQRARRGTRATNFRREEGLISFSGPSDVLASPDRVQDRLGWVLQLVGIVAADPARRAPGAQVLLPVVGTGVDLDLWTFVCTGVESVADEDSSDAGAAGPVTPALHFVREPRGLYDLRVQVWLDPLRHYLPVRWLQQSGPSDAGVELRRRAGDQ